MKNLYTPPRRNPPSDVSNEAFENVKQSTVIRDCPTACALAQETLTTHFSTEGDADDCSDACQVAHSGSVPLLEHDTSRV